MSCVIKVKEESMAYMDSNQVREIVICSAVKTTTGEIIRGHRHPDCKRTIEVMGLKWATDPTSEGFISSKNRFVDRQEALRLQIEAGIESIDAGGYMPGGLCSEDLY